MCENTVLFHSGRFCTLFTAAHPCLLGLPLCLGYFSCYSDKAPDKGNLREKGFILAPSLRVQLTVAGRSRLQELKAAAHMASMIRNRAWCIHVLNSPSPFHTAPKWCPSYWVGLSTSVNLIKTIPHGWAQRLISLVTVKLLKLTVKIHFHTLFTRHEVISNCALCCIEEVVHLLLNN